jgi:hypothetical protein
MATLRKRGVPTAVICTEPFLKLARAQSKVFGVPDLPAIMIPHPLGGVSIEQVEGRAHAAWPQLAKLIEELGK